MKAIFISDIHASPKHYISISKFAKKISAQKADYFFMLGDIGEGVDNFEFVLKEFKNVSPNKYVIPGNHDYYDYGISASKIIEDSIFENLCKKYGYNFSPQDPIIIGDSAVIINTAWHNLSWSSHIYPLNEMQRNMHYSIGMSDPGLIDVKYSVFHEKNIAIFKEQLDKVSKLEKLETLIIGTHWPILKESYRPYVERNKINKIKNIWDDDEIKKYATNEYRKYNIESGFLSPEFGEYLYDWISKQSKDKLPEKIQVISGHTHMGFESNICNLACPVKFTIIDADYGLLNHYSMEI